MPRLKTQLMCEACGLEPARHFRLVDRCWVCLHCLDAADLERYRSELSKHSRQPRRCAMCRRGEHRQCFGLITDFGDVRSCGCPHVRKQPPSVVSLRRNQ